MEIFFSIVAIFALVFACTIIIDRTVFFQRVKKIIPGMTGKDITFTTGLYVSVLKVDKSKFYGSVRSTLRIFSYTLVFENGKLVSKNRD